VPVNKPIAVLPIFDHQEFEPHGASAALGALDRALATIGSRERGSSNTSAGWRAGAPAVSQQPPIIVDQRHRFVRMFWPGSLAPRTRRRR